MDMKKYYEKLEKIYDFNKLETKEIELFEILNKVRFYMNKSAKRYLLPLYAGAFFLITLIAKVEAQHALKK